MEVSRESRQGREYGKKTDKTLGQVVHWEIWVREPFDVEEDIGIEEAKGEKADKQTD